jgi:hypothetical protein
MALDSISKFIKSGIAGSPETPQPAAPVSQEEKEESMFKQYGPKQALLEWVSAGKLQTINFNQKFIRLGGIIALVVAILFALMQDFAILLMIASVIAFYYILTKKYAGADIFCQLNNYGLVYGGKTYHWGSLRRFFFITRGSEELLIVDLVDAFFPRLLITFPADKKGEIERILKEHIMLLEKEPKSTFDKSVDSLMSKLNFEDKGFEEKK